MFSSSMATENSSNRSSIDIQSELYLHPTESPNFLLASDKLNGENFPQWRRAAEIALSARNKLGFVDGSAKAPDSGSPLVSQWNRCNNLVISWILHSLEPGIASSILYCQTAQEIWGDLAERFSQSNAPRLFQLHKEIVTLVQGTDSVCEYFTKLKGLWDNYFAMITLPRCRCDSAGSYFKLLQDQQLLQFLMGLNDSFKTARGNVLMMKPLPTLNQAYKLISQEETQRDCTSGALINSESSALASIQQTSSNPYNKIVFGTTPSGKKSKYFCQHCKIYGHSIERCFKIHGYPKPSKGNSFANIHGTSQGREVAGNAYSEGNDGLISSPHQQSFSSDIHVSLSPSQYSQLIGLLSKHNVDNETHEKAPDFLSGHMASSVHLAGQCEEDFSASW